MAETGNPQSPQVLRGAIIQLMEDLGIITPNIIPFQYNPATMTRNLRPWNPFEVDQANRGAQAPMVQPYDPEETYSFTLDLDATDDLEDGDPIAVSTGVASRIAAIQKLIEPSKGLFGDLIASAQSLAGDIERQAARASVPIALFVMGPGLILPIRVTSLSIEVKEFTPALYPHMAEIQLELRVLTPEVFKCRRGAAIDLAIAAYDLTRLQEDGLAIANFANSLKAARSMLPF
ncbi:hypothetical protein [Nitrosospira sp. Nsp13]|uniref:hypothetical protein n=1 Tax=Nitrosospira sp. Nsp13 TaxID=1855332 RepID=UPI00087E32BE|nr:hypothetical protein [Nitrosospira sp. Nsp13]SCX79648.1 hypothetical protein SAMN05216308_101282 [Nitrosospira sp. Nsp13]